MATPKSPRYRDAVACRRRRPGVQSSGSTMPRKTRAGPGSRSTRDGRSSCPRCGDSGTGQMQPVHPATGVGQAKFAMRTRDRVVRRLVRGPRGEGAVAEVSDQGPRRDSTASAASHPPASGHARTPSVVPDASGRQAHATALGSAGLPVYYPTVIASGSSCRSIAAGNCRVTPWSDPPPPHPHRNPRPPGAEEVRQPARCRQPAPARRSRNAPGPGHAREAAAGTGPEAPLR
jgi:hypothetical protein